MKNTNTELFLTDEQGKKLCTFPIIKGTDGPDAFDIRELHHSTGYLTFDPGFFSTASCTSAITFTDGQEGILRYRGYNIEDLAKNSHFLEVAYLLLKGDLPTKKNFDVFHHDIVHHSMLHEQLTFFFRGFRRDAHPMSIMVGVVGALSAFYHDSLDINDPDQRTLASYRLIAKLPTIAAMAYKYHIGQPFAYPQNHLSYAANILHMMFAVPTEPYHVNKVFEDALDKILILHADHEQNASTSTVRLAGSSQANPFACIAAGIASLWGPAHGGANEAVLTMLKKIGHKDNIPSFLEKVKNKKDGVRLMGFGHRVYKNFDPRAQVLREICRDVLKEAKQENNPLFELALELETIATQDDYFKKRNLYPNVDFYSGIILQAIGIPTSMFTVLFAVARTVGWVAQWTEMVADKTKKIGRPRQLYTGHTKRPFKPAHAR